MTIEQIKRAISEYYSDTRRSQEETRDGLQELADEIESLMGALE